jgi:hypothetical protein
MRLRYTTLTLALLLGITTAAAAAQQGTKGLAARKKHPQLHHVHGVVVAVEHDKMKGHGEIKVKVQRKHHKKAAKTAAAVASPKKKHQSVMTFKVGPHTKFERVIHSQGKVHRQKAQFGEVRPGEHVRVAFNSQHHAVEVEIIVHQRNKKLTPTVAPAKRPPLKKLK